MSLTMVAATAFIHESIIQYDRFSMRQVQGSQLIDCAKNAKVMELLFAYLGYAGPISVDKLKPLNFFKGTIEYAE